ncbi:family 43 glycosylhydrolase [Paenibacillus ferrarius]|nr:family 43 glycosylhydrolase [Paenibacillus ferrarius]
MSKKLTVFLLALTLLLSVVPSASIYAQSNEDTLENPFIWADVPDLDVIRVGDAYYMSSTTMHMNPGVPIMKSYDLKNWEIVNYVYDMLADNDEQALRNGKDNYGKGSWASSLRYHNGKYYVAFPSYDTGKTYIYQTTDIEKGPWTHSELDGVYHDMSLLFDDDGRVYMVYGGGDIKAIELTPDATAIKPGGLNKVIIPNASLVASTAENVSLPAEGTHIQKINGKYYVFNITWPKNSGRVEIMHRADRIDGVYEGKVALNNAGIAQGGIIDTADGKWYAMLFGDRGSVGRIPYLVPVTWNDGWPVFGINGTVPQSMAIPVIGAASKNNWVASDEFYQSSQKIGASHTVINTSSSSTTSPTVTTPVTPLPINEGTELLVNGGIENGLTPWEKHDTATVAVTTDEHFSGTNSLYISGRGATGAGVQQFVTGKIKAGAIYKFSAKVKYNAGPATKQFNFDIQDGDWTTIKIIGSGVMTKGEWGTIEGTYTVPADATFTLPRIFIETIWTAAQDPTNDLMNFYADDISFVDVTPDGNLLTNGKMEKGLTPWEKHDTATVAVSTNEHFSGTNSLFISGRAATGAGVQQFVTGKVTAGSKYKFSAKVKYNAGPATRVFNFDIQDGDWQTIKVLGSGVMTKGVWGTIEGTYTVPDNAVFNQPRIFIETSWTAAQDLTNDLMDFYVDDISLIDATPTGGLDKAKNGEYDYNGSNLGLVWQWNHNPDNNHWSLTERPGYLRLTTGRKSTSILDARNTLTQRTFGPESSGNVALDISKMKDGDYAGLAAFQKEYGFVGIKMSGTSKSIVMVDGSSGTPVEKASIPVTQDNVYFKIDFDYKNQTDKAYFYYSLNGLTWTAIGNTLQMHYTLPHFMGYRFGLFNYATKTTGGIVDFDYFRIDDKLTGTNSPATVLQANLANVPNVIGVQNIELQVPVQMNALPNGNYSAISASLNIPKELTVTGVDFNKANIVGDTSYTFANNQLLLHVTGNTVNFANNQSSDVFATIKLKVNGFVPADQTVQIKTDYIKVDGGNVRYNVNNTVSNIGLKQLPTNAYAKIPGYANPLMSHKLGADPFAMVYDGRVYIYMSSDDYEYDANGKIKDNSFSNLNRIFVISSADMVNWTDHGAIPVAGKNNVNNGAGVAKWADLSWAPAAAHKKINGVDKFFLYFANGASGIGVLTADSPIGPWTDPLGQALITSNSPGVPGVAWLFDPAVLVDDDGTGYLYFGGGIPGDPNPTPEQIAHPKTARVVKLADDMIHMAGAAVTIDAPYMFEDSGIHKYNGKYYYSYCSNFSGTHPDGTPPPGEIAYMVSDSPMGPFTYVSPILKNPSVFFGVGGNNHHAIFEFNDQWYVVYHAQTVSKAVVGDGKGYRSPHINKVEYYDNGLIKDIKGDMKGVSQIANLDPYSRVEAETIAWNAGILTEVSTAPGNPLASLNLDVTDINNGDWLAVSNADFGDKGAASFEANMASTVGGKVEIRLDSPIGKVIGTLDVAPTGGDQVWQLLKTDVENVKGIHNIFFMFSGSGSKLFNMDYWKFNVKAPGPVVIPLESVHITGGAQSVTVNDQLTFNSMINPSSVTGATYLWEVSGGISIIGDNRKDSVTIKGTNAGTGTLKLTVLAGGTEKKAETTITVSPSSVDPVDYLHSVTITGGSQSVTVNDQLTFNSMINPTSVTGATYLWEASGGINIVGESNQVTVTIRGVSAGTGTLKLTVNAGGTKKTAETTITVSPSSVDPVNPLQAVTITGGSQSVTVNDQITFNSMINPTSVTGATYLWEANGGISIVGESNQDKVTIRGVSAGTGTLKLTVIAGSTKKTAETIITVSPLSSGGDDNNHSGNNGGSSTTTTPESSGKEADILVNGKKESVGNTATTQANGQTVTTITIDQMKLVQLLAAVGEKANITVRVTNNSDIVIGQLNAQMVKSLQENKADLEIKTDRATYTLPSQLIDIPAISGQVGNSVALQDITIQIKISKPTADMVKVVENAADKDQFTLVVPSIDFTVGAAYGGKIIDLSKFNAYVKRTIAIPDGVDPNKITTAVVVEPDGTVRHVPTKLVIIDGKYYAEVSSLTNSTYSLIWHPVAFSDVSTHWAKDAVNNLGSRMIISGIGNDLFNPEADITRAEFAAIIVRGLGLKLENRTPNFSDVKAADWYSSAIMTAQSSHLIDGFEDGTFRPGDKITREQAMVIMAKAMAITGLKAKLTNHNAADVLRGYTDATESAPWAMSGIADSIQAGIVSGRDEAALAPKAYITRAEVAKLVQQLLRKSDLLS